MTTKDDDEGRRLTTSIQVKYYNAEKYEVKRYEDAVIGYQVSRILVQSPMLPALPAFATKGRVPGKLRTVANYPSYVELGNIFLAQL